MKALRMIDRVFNYARAHCDMPHPILEKVIEDNRTHPMAGMQIDLEQGALMKLFVQMLNAKTVVEIGTFTGFSSICLASGLSEDGHLHTFDRSEEYTNIAKKYWKEAELDNKITLHLGDALENLKFYLKETPRGSIDLVFIDADKVNIPNYYELTLESLRPGGLVLVDNVLWGGKAADAYAQDESTVAIQKFNEQVMKDSRVERILLPVADGLFILRKKGS